MVIPGLRPTDELVRRAIIGDGTAFTELWDTNIGALKEYLRCEMHIGDDFFLDDICSKSFEKAFRQIGSFDPSKSRFPTWLRVIAHNTALDTLEQERRIQRSYVRIYDADADLEAIENIGDEVDTPLESIIKEETRETTRSCIEGLPDLYKDIAWKRLMDDMSYKDIAEETGLPLNTVRTRIRRAKAIIEGMKKEEKDV